MNNENKDLSRKRKRRIEHKVRMDDRMNSLLNKIKTEKKRKYKNNDKIKNSEIQLVKIEYADKPGKLKSALREINKVEVIDKYLHDIKQEKVRDYTKEFEMFGSLKVGDQIRQTHIRFRNFDDYESYIKSMDEGYDAEDAIFNGYFYKLYSPQFNRVNRSQYGNGCNFKQQIIEYHGNNCYIPSNGYCFIKFLYYLTMSDYKEQYLDFIGN